MTPRVVQGDEPLHEDELTAEQLACYVRLTDRPQDWALSSMTPQQERRLQTLAYLAGLSKATKR